MTIEEAIRTAIEYETRVRDLYREAVERAGDGAGGGLFRLMAEEEQHHLDYLASKLRELKATGAVKPGGLRTALPDTAALSDGTAVVKGALSGEASGAEMEYLSQAHSAETETSAFYERVVSELPEGERDVFADFLAIERSHLALVQAQIDELAGTGYWFDVREFNLED